MTLGEIVFFKKVSSCTTLRKFDSQIFGIMLGRLAPGQKPPKPEQLFQLIGNIGFVSFDDVIEFLGPENTNILMEKFKDKYYGKILPIASAPRDDIQ